MKTQSSEKSLSETERLLSSTKIMIKSSPKFKDKLTPNQVSKKSLDRVAKWQKERQKLLVKLQLRRISGYLLSLWEEPAPRHKATSNQLTRRQARSE